MIQTASLSQQIEETLKAEILAGNFEPGQRITIEELSENWGVSICTGEGQRLVFGETRYPFSI